MKLFIAFLCLLALTRAQANETESTVYSCQFTDSSTNSSSLRMKKYIDSITGAPLGKVDLLLGATVLESTPTQVYQIPLWESDTLMQIWRSPELRVDAQLTLRGRNVRFSAIYNKGPLKRPLYCTTLPQ